MPPKNKKGKLTFTRFLLKAAFYISILSAIVVLIVMNFLPVENIAILIISIEATVFVITWAVFSHLLKRRLNAIHSIAQNITHKEFEDYRTLSRKNKDELDALIQECVTASRTMALEIERLNKIENYRKEFLGDVSHELKTPIFAIQGFIETLLDGAIDDKSVNRQFLEKALNNTNRLTYLTKDLLEISKLETGELKSNFQKVNLLDLVNDVIETLQYKAELEGVLIHQKRIDPNLVLKADRRQLRQVFINLIENAIKYNKIGGLVTISTKAAEMEDTIQISVKDNGIGIEPQYIERITERFFRIDKSRSRKKGGTGLGLAIVKHIIEAHGDRLKIASTPGIGSEFSFTLERYRGI